MPNDYRMCWCVGADVCRYDTAVNLNHTVYVIFIKVKFLLKGKANFAIHGY